MEVHTYKKDIKRKEMKEDDRDIGLLAKLYYTFMTLLRYWKILASILLKL